MTGVETELKLEAEPEDLPRLLRHLPFPSDACETQQLVGTYFDTPDRAVRHSGHMLRIRRSGGHHVQTVKADRGAAAGLFARDEWERSVPGDAPVIDASSGPLLQAIGHDGVARLEPVFLTDVERTTWQVAWEGADIEISIDRGVVRAGDRTAPVAEVELELRGGDPRVLFDVARRLDGEVPLRLAIESKAERGYALLDAAAARPLTAEPVHLDPAMSAPEALRVIVLSCIRHYRRNEAILLHADDSEALHQAHVALRRLRTALSLFRPLLRGDPDARLIDAELRRYAAELGEARDLDVQTVRAGREVPRQLLDARTRALEHVRTELRSARPRLILLDLVEWLHAGHWPRTRRAIARADEPLLRFAGVLLDRRRRRLKRLAHGLARRGARRAHRVRIEAKKARYAAEFLGSLWPSPAAREKQAAWSRGVERVQDRLGTLNDIAVGRRILRGLGVETNDDLGRGGRTALRRQARDQLRRLMEVAPFWAD